MYNGERVMINEGYGETRVNEQTGVKEQWHWKIFDEGFQSNNPEEPLRWGCGKFEPFQVE